MSVALDLDALDFAKGGGTVTVVAQDVVTGRVLMIAAADREALEATLRTGEMHYRSRTRGLWRKGATSGNVQVFASLAADCDGDAVLALVRQSGGACHTGAASCFASSPPHDILETLDDVIVRRADAVAPQGPSHTRRLLDDRNLRLKKLGEECSELVVALADRDRERAGEEAADLFYHLLVALRAEGVGLADLRGVLDQRRRA
jgi:phosphoribosyl-ATP pyrophosphohydrolase/phosphoribosyl-AMP cyclohydrolase